MTSNPIHSVRKQMTKEEIRRTKLFRRARLMIPAAQAIPREGGANPRRPLPAEVVTVVGCRCQPIPKRSKAIP